MISDRYMYNESRTCHCRLETTLQIGWLQTLENAALSEYNFSETYRVVLPRSDSSLGTPDATSVFALQYFHPALLKSVSPLSVEADGNCLYRSASLSVCGKQDYHVLIRLMVLIELVLNCLSLAMYM